MKNLNKNKMLSVVFFFIGFILLITISMMAVMNATTVNLLDSDRTDISMELAEVEKIGKSMSYDCGEEVVLLEANDGYEIYKMTFEVKNSSPEETYTIDFGVDFVGAQYDDVYTVWLEEPYYENPPLFSYDAQPYIPAYRTAKLIRYVQVKEGVEEIQVTYYTDSYYEKQSELSVTIS